MKMASEQRVIENSNRKYYTQYCKYNFLSYNYIILIYSYMSTKNTDPELLAEEIDEKQENIKS